MATESKSDSLLQSPIHLLHRAGQCAEDLFDAEVGKRDLTARQFAVLIAVAEDQGASQTDLVKRTGIDRSTLGGLVLRLQRKRLLQRRRKVEDSRTYAVKLTDEGRRLLRAAEPLSKRVDERVLDALSSKKREQFIDALVTIVDSLQALASEGSEQAERVGGLGAALKRRR
jgi:MarR family transcriptional regulator, temperature-dependent positive regulator of motility